MPRARYNVLVLPFRGAPGAREYAVFHRSDGEMWQFIAGGGEDDETPLEAARREAFEEGGIEIDTAAWIRLDAVASIPRTAFPGAGWPADVYVVPEHCFGIDIGDHDLVLSAEHDRCVWLDYEAATARLTWDSNRTALWELHERLRHQRSST